MPQRGADHERSRSSTIESRAIEPVPVQHIDRVRGETTLCFNGCEMRAIAESSSAKTAVHGLTVLPKASLERGAIRCVAEEGHSKAFETILSDMENTTKGDA